MIKWSSDYAIGIRRIDFEHRVLFAMIADFEKARLLGVHEDVLQDHLSEIAAFAKYQFLQEEHMLARRGFADLKTHSRKHAEFMDLIFNITLSSRLGRVSYAQSGVFLGKWIADHIKQDDIKFASPHFQRRHACVSGIELSTGISPPLTCASQAYGQSDRNGVRAEGRV